MRLGLIELMPEETCDKVEGFGDGRTGGTAEPEPEGFGANSPGRMTKPNLIMLYSAAAARALPARCCGVSSSVAIRLERMAASRVVLSIFWPVRSVT